MTGFDFTIDRDTLPDTYQYARSRLERGDPRAMHQLLKDKLGQQAGRMTIAVLQDLGHEIVDQGGGNVAARRDESDLGEQEKYAVGLVREQGDEGYLMADLTSVGLAHSGGDNQDSGRRGRYWGMLNSLIRRGYLVEARRQRVWVPEFVPGNQTTLGV